jgi:hypothetical protein
MKIAQIYRENAPCVFGIWQGQQTFGVRPLATFSSEAEAQSYRARCLTLPRDMCKALESEACGALVRHGGGPRARKLLADALRAWRRFGDRERARWLIRHAYFVAGEVRR